MKTVIGIDPGKSGALVAMKKDGTVAIQVMPIVGKDIDVGLLVEWLGNFAKSAAYMPLCVCIEKVHAMPGQGVTSMFSFGYGVGLLHGIVRTIGIPLYEVSPQAWQKEVLSFTTKDKSAAAEYVRKAYPDVPIMATSRSTKPHTGIVDAICIARYGIIKL